MRGRMTLASKSGAIARHFGRGRKATGRPMEALERRVLFSVYTVTNLNDSGPGLLRDAITQANLHPGANTVTFASGLNGSITLTTGTFGARN